MQKTLLLVDDVKTNREILKKILGDEYLTLEAAGGQEALCIMRREFRQIAMVLLDLGMPGMDGYEVLSVMRADPALKSLPVIVATGRTDKASEIKALQLGANDYISKPYNATILQRRVSNVISLYEAAATVNELQTDRLTGLYSRAAFFEKAAEMLRSHQPGFYVMACFDVNNFKVINDQYGTDKGDEVLCSLADIFRHGFAPFGGLCSRIMADSYAVLYPYSMMDSEALAAIRHKTAVLDGSIPPISYNIGRYIVDDLSLPVSAMYDRAVLAQNSIKGRYDKNIALFDESMRKDLIAEQQIVMEMDQALVQGQFEPWYQPQYNHATGDLLGAEALVRWRHPQKGLLAPSLFIPVFEKNSFIYELDKYIWESICRNLRRWIDAGRNPLPISVNISRCDVFKDDLMDVLSGLIRRYDLPVELLRLEITESAFSTNAAQIISTVKQLIQFGFTVEIDDFGSGYSSLNTLKDVPAQIIKLDMKFLESSSDSQRGGNILESVIRMAKWLGMSVIAEGVETKQQADFLKSIGCVHVQGYLYAKPMPVQEYEALAAGSIKQRGFIALETVENLDNNAFWSPESMDTLIFNSYLGSACIYECYKDALELLRANDKYIRMLGSAGMTLNDALKRNWSDYLNGAGREKISVLLRQAAKTGTECTTEFSFCGRPGCADKTYLRSTLRVIATVGDRMLIYCTSENITAQHLAEQKRQEATELLRFLDSMAHDLLALPDTEAGIGTILQNLLEFFRGDRAYVFEFDFDSSTVSNTYEYCAAGVRSEKSFLQQLSLDAVSFWLHAFDKQNYISIEDVDALCDDRPEKALLQAQRIHALVAVPLRRSGNLIGFVGVDDPRQRLTQIARLSALGDYIAVILTRRDLNAEISSGTQEKLAIMDGIPGGFVRMRLRPDGTIIPLYHSEGFQKLVGMDSDALMRLYGNNALAGVHPDDVGIFEDAIAEMVAHGEVQNARYRLHFGQGGYLWVTIFGKMRKASSGETFINVYYTASAEQKRREDIQLALLDNLPCGAALYAFDGERMTVIHLNRNFWKLVKSQPLAYETISILDFVHPDDRERVLPEVIASIAEERDSVCDVRILCGDATYSRFHVVGHTVPLSGGGYRIYAAYTPVSDETAAMRDILPVLLSTIMESTTDLSFVKDKELRYVCSSRTFANLVGLAHANNVIGKTDYDLFDAAIADKYRRDDEALLKGGASLIDMEEEIPSTDGLTHYSSTSKHLLRDSYNNIIGIYGVGRDITKSRDAFDWLRLLADNLPGGIATYTCTAESTRILYFNDGLCRLFGYTRREYESLCAADPLQTVVAEDRSKLEAQLCGLVGGSADAECIFRAHTKTEACKWISARFSAVKRRRGGVVVNAILMDVTKQQETVEQLRLSEEENRLAVMHSGNTLCRFHIAERTLSMSPDVAARLHVPEKISNVPDAQIRQGLIAAGSEKAYAEFFRSILRGDARAEAVYQFKMPDGWRWLEAHASAIADNTGKPVSAILSFFDVTDRLEKETVYKKWQQSFAERAPESYSLLRCNLNKGAVFDTVNGTLLHVDFSQNLRSLRDWTQEYANTRVHKEDQDAYIALLDENTLLANYYAGKRYEELEYRERSADGELRWLRLTVELVEYPNSTDIGAYFMFENIDHDKKETLRMMRRAESDSLTGIFNRTAFAERMDRRLALSRRKKAFSALFILDLDNFKRVNDQMGHVAGDSALVAVSQALTSQLRSDDLTGRLGGDEFVACLFDLPSRAVIAQKADAICACMRALAGFEQVLSSSIGIAVYPDDGTNFNDLYYKADTALYHAKECGKSNYAFYDKQLAGTKAQP